MIFHLLVGMLPYRRLIGAMPVNKVLATLQLCPERIEGLVECTTPASNRWEDFVRTKPLLGEGVLNYVQYKKQHFFVTHRQSYFKKERLRQLYITVCRHLGVDLSFTGIRININIYMYMYILQRTRQSL